MSTGKIIVGAGRHAAETFYLMHDIDASVNVLGFAVDDPGSSTEFMGKKLFRIKELIDTYKGKTEKPKVLVAIGTVEVNKRLVQLFRDAGFSFFNAIHPSIKTDRQAFIGQGVTICEGTVFTCNISVGNHAIINIGCTISHDCVIGDHVNISPGCHLAGNVHLENDVFVGTGATFIPKVRVGRGSIVAAGACVTTDVPPGSMVAGVPAIVKKQLTA
jgi:acetyltransferase EpsM